LSLQYSILKQNNCRRMVQTFLVKAPVSGTVANVKVSAGDTVSQGGLLAIQSMVKTQTQVPAPIGGRVKTIAQEGASLAEGDTLAEIEY